MQRAAYAALTASLLLALFAFVWRGTYTRYVTDDFCTAHVLRSQGFARAMSHHRESWSGRYTYYAVKGALEAIGPVTARFVPGVLIALTAVSAAWVIGGRRGTMAGAAIALAAVDAAPDPFGFYGPVMWETGALTYMLPMILLLLWGGLFARGRGAAAGGVLLLAAGGLSETSLIAQCVLVAGALAFSVRHRDNVRARIAGAGLIASCVAAVIVVTAPGNALRAASAQARQSLTGAALQSLGFANDFIGSHVLLEGSMLIVVALLGTLAPVRLADRPRWIEAVLVLVAAYGASFLPSSWWLSVPPPPRALYVSQFLLILAVYAAGAALRTTVVPVVLIVAALIPLSSGVATIRTIPAARRDAAHADRIAELLRPARGQDVVLRSGWALQTAYIVNDPAHWANHCICRYYGLRSLRVVR